MFWPPAYWSVTRQRQGESFPPTMTPHTASKLSLVPPALLVPPPALPAASLHFGLRSSAAEVTLPFFDCVLTHWPVNALYHLVTAKSSDLFVVCVDAREAARGHDVEGLDRIAADQVLDFGFSAGRRPCCPQRDALTGSTLW
jgi:hypothetical protein